MSQKALADIVAVTQGAIAHWETGRSTRVDAGTVARLERALGLPAGELARHLPADHPARRMAAAEIPVLGVVAAGPARDEPAEPGEVLRVADVFAGCVAYRVRGDSMLGDQVRSGDYLIVRPADASPLEVGQVVVAWLADPPGHVVKRLHAHNWLRSNGPGRARWSHKLTDADRVLGRLVGVVRLC